MMNIPYLSLQSITAMHGEEIQEAVARVTASGWYLQGKENAAFEQEYATFCHSRHCIGVANGLDALTLMIRAYKETGRLADEDEVLVPANTYIATILAITANNLKPVLIEPDERFLIDSDRAIEAITEKTKAIVAVNLYGYNACTEKLTQACKKYGLLLFIDNAQGHGLKLPSYAAEGLEGAVAHSFYPGKNLGALGDGGAVTCDDDDICNIIRSLANYGSSRKYVFDYCGRNSRLDEIQAAVLRVKLRYLTEDNRRRQEIAERLIMELDCDSCRNEGIFTPPSGKEDGAVFHIFPLLTDCRQELQEHLTAQGIGTMIHYPIPPHKQKCYSQAGMLFTPDGHTGNDISLPVTEALHRRELSLPCNPAMNDEQVEMVIRSIKGFKKQNSNL